MSKTLWRFAGLLLTLLLAIPAFASSAGAAPRGNAPWWRRAVVYEIFVRSFQDSNGDGIGDLNGITSRLDYLKELGVDAIWLTPCYPSPQVDFGYDVSNYTAIASEYGTMADFDRLVAEARKRDIRVIMDLVLNHTSVQHPWFIQSRSSKDNQKRNWYTWRDGRAPGQPPNEWKSQFQGSAWTYDDGTKQYYFHQFWPEQPDLNWRNPEVRRAMSEVVEFWLQRGVAGFRLDAVPSLFEDPQFRDDPGGSFDPMPENHAALKELHETVAHFAGERVLIGETYAANAAELAKWYGAGNEIDLPLNFQFDLVNRLSATDFKSRLDDLVLGGGNLWPSNFLSSHDQSRHIDRYGDKVHDQEIAKLLAVLLLTARGTPTLYYGEEVGMTTHTPSRIEDVKDTDGIRNWPEKKGRDGERTPMQWSSNANAGFSTGKPWLPVSPDFATNNVEAQKKDPDSILNHYRRMLALRRTQPALLDGDYVPLPNRDEGVLSFIRRDSSTGSAVLVILNMSEKTRVVSYRKEELGLRSGRIRELFRTNRSIEPPDATLIDPAAIELPAFGALVGSIE